MLFNFLCRFNIYLKFGIESSLKTHHLPFFPPSLPTPSPPLPSKKQGNFALSLEIGSSAAVQISLIQIPVLFLFSVALHGSDPDCGSFTLVFPAMDMLAVIFSTLILSFIAFEGL